VVFYIFLVAALNLGLGFGVAVYLGWRYRTAMVADDAWSTGAALGQTIDGVLTGEEHVAGGVEILSHQPPEQQSADATAATRAQRAPQTTTGPPQSEEIGPARSSSAPPETSPAEKSLDELTSEVQHYDEQVAYADEKLRACVDDPEAPEIEAILASLADSTQQYLESRDRVHGTLKNADQGQPGAGGICDHLQAAIERQDEQIQCTSAMIESFDYQSDLEEGCRQMLHQTGRLSDSNSHLREVLCEVKVKLAGNQQHPQQVKPTTRKETPRERSGRTDLEAELLKRWDRGSQRAPDVSLAVIELDHAADLQQRHGRETAEKIFCAVGQLLESGDEGRLFGLSEGRFSVLLLEADVRLAANHADRWRQTIEQAHLHHGSSEIRVTVSCAVVGAASEGAPGRLIERAERTLEEAKRYGGNRTFLYDGKYPAPVVPPNFSLEATQLTL
jgi:diguanylate cyclase (GGDEF)-like protein